MGRAMVVSRAGVVSIGCSCIFGGGSSVMRYSSPNLPGTRVEVISPFLMRRLTVLGDTPKASAAWLMVRPSLLCMALDIGYTKNGLLSSGMGRVCPWLDGVFEELRERTF